jgi:hypothetical protein
VGGADMYDAAGALLLPVDRMRRWLTPADINGTGTVGQWQVGPGAPNRGPDAYGRVEFTSYFRPPGSPGVINTTSTTPPGLGQSPNGAIGFGTWLNGQLTPWGAGSAYQPDVTNNFTHGFESFRFPNQNYNAANGFTPQRLGGVPIDQNPDATGVMPSFYPTYDYAVNASVHSDGLNDADEMNLYTYNPLLDSPYGYGDLEWLYRLQDVDGASLTSRLKTLAPISFTNGIDGQRRRRLFALDAWESTGFAWTNDNPGNAFPNNFTFGVNLNNNTGQNASMAQLGANVGNQGLPTPSLAHRDRKINLNYPLPVSNDPNEPVRQKWIHDTYYMLKATLPPRAVDSPEELAQLSQFVINIVDFRDPDNTMTHWVNPDVVISNVVGAGAGNVMPGPNTPPLILLPSNAAGVATMQLDQYGMEFSPVAINEALAYTFQYQGGVAGGGGAATAQGNRFMIELVNTLTMPEVSSTSTAVPPNLSAAVLDLGGFQYTPGDPYSGGCYDIVFTADDQYSRPDPFRGELPIFGNIFALTPLNRDTFSSTYNNPTFLAGNPVTLSDDVRLQPLLPAGQPVTVNANTITPANGPNVATTGTSVPQPTLPNFAAASPLPTDYFYVIGNLPPSASPTGAGATQPYESGPIQPDSYYCGVLNAGVLPGSPLFPAPFSVPPGGLNGYQIPGSYTPANGGAPVTVGTPSMIQSFAAGYDPMTAGANPNFKIYQGILPGIPANGVVPPPNYQWKVFNGIPPAAGAAQKGAQFFWVCLRRPANLFAPVSATNPMVVVDAMRVPYIDGTGSNVVPKDKNGNPAVNGTFNTIYSVQRYQPYRGGQALPLPTYPGVAIVGNANANPPVAAANLQDTRYGYTEQVVPPSANSQPTIYTRAPVNPPAPAPTQGIYFVPTGPPPGGAQTPPPNAATMPVYHTMGWANEYEKGSIVEGTGAPNPTVLIEGWDYLPLHDRDFTSVAELTLVPACPPGLFTKQFAEFVPSQMNVASFFSAVTPQTTPGVINGQANGNTTFSGVYTNPPTQNIPVIPANTGNQPQYWPAPGLLYPAPTANLAPANVVNLATATTPLLSPQATYPPPLLTAGTPVQPHTYPYLSDKFFYTGASNILDAAPALGASGLVGGQSADGWFKMFEFFEVPSQMLGAIGPVAQGTNFDWARQDMKPGLLNLNLIIDEEVFLSLLGKQVITQQSGQYNAPNFQNDTMNPQVPSDQFNQQYMNMVQVQPLPAGNYAQNPNFTALSTLAGANTTSFALPLPAGTNPMPLVVTSALSNGSPGSAFPLSSTSLAAWQNWAGGGALYQANPTTGPGLLAADPIANYMNAQANPAGVNPIYNNGLKASFVQFLSLRHGGSGYLYGWGSGAVNQNLSVTAQLGAGTPAYTGIPTERPFHSLSYPDIDYTIMRPAVLPPNALYTVPALNMTPILPLGTGDYYAGDPGVRSPSQTTLANQAYQSNFPPGVAPTGNPAVFTFNPVFPPPIPARRLFQLADAYAGIPGTPPSGTVPAPSNASESGDPIINNTTPPANAPAAPIPATGALPNVTQGVANTIVPSDGVVNLFWPGGSSLVYSAGMAAPGSNAPNPYLGSNNAGAVNFDYRQHPYWRSEAMQKVMNQTTVRTHQYAVWITIGFFRLKRQGDIGMASVGIPTLAYDIMGPEKGALDGSNVRYRGFFLVDRLRLTGFDPGNAGVYRPAIVYKQRIE